LNKAEDVDERITLLFEVSDSAGRQNAARQFVRQALHGRVRDCGNVNSHLA